MIRHQLDPLDLRVRAVHLWQKRWLLLTAGDFTTGHFNTMTVAWGSIGCMWNLPMVHVVVRPNRYTREFVERHDNFTLTAFPPDLRQALSHLGTHSGRDGDKIKAAGLTPQASRLVSAPVFAEAELCFECRKIFAADMQAEHFLDERIAPLYPDQDYHRVYFGEIVGLYGSKEWS